MAEYYFRISGNNDLVKTPRLSRCCPNVRGKDRKPSPNSAPTTTCGKASKPWPVPVSYNPVEMALLKYKEMQRFITAHDAFDELKSNGLLKYATASQRGPEGWTKIDDRLGTVFGPRRGAVKLPPGSQISAEGFGEGSLRPEDVQVAVCGSWETTEHLNRVARVINNYLSPACVANLRCSVDTGHPQTCSTSFSLDCRHSIWDLPAWMPRRRSLR